MKKTLNLGVIGIDHGHIFDMLDEMIKEGCSCNYFWTDGDPLTLQEFNKKYPNIKRKENKEEILNDSSIDMILISSIPLDRAGHSIDALKAGQMSLHHPRVVHGSGINKSNDRRIGFVIQSYIGTNVKQTLGKNSVQIARGKDKYHHHEIINRTNTLMSEESILLRKKENDYLQEIFYKGAKQKGSY